MCVCAQDEQGLLDSDAEEGKAQLSRVQGYVVPMPLHFLSQEDLQPPFGSKEFITPEVFQ